MRTAPHPRERSLPELFRSAAEDFAGHPVILGGARPLDFARFGDLSDRVAAGLALRGIRKGDRVALYSTNSPGFALAYAGIVKAGAVVVPINLLLNPREIAYILDDSGAQALIHSESLTEGAAAARAHSRALSFAVSIGRGVPKDSDPSHRDLLSSPSQPPDLAWSPAEDLAAVLYTSGTTGKPKGAMLTHRNLVANTFSIREALKLEPRRDILLVVLPLFHSFAATVGMLFPLLHGCTFVPMERFEPQLVARTIEEHRVTILPAVPSMYASLLRLGDEHIPKFASLRFCISGGAALPVEILERFEARFGKRIYEGDGPTECSPVTCVNPVGGKTKKGSVGRAIPDVEMRILDDRGEELPRGEVGEICVRGPNVMKGYWNRPDETRESFFGDWFRTGDLGYEDGEGYFFIVDRKKDLIILNGMNVYPRVIEEVLYRMPAVKEAAVVGEPHRLHGEIPTAFVVLHEGEWATADEIRAFCREHLGRHEIPRKVHFVDKLPRTASGKIIKRELRRDGEVERGIES